MKNKLLIMLFLSVISCIIIYSILKENKFYYLAIGEIPRDQYRYEYQDYVIDYLLKENKHSYLNKNFLRENYDTKEILNMIKEAKTSVVNGSTETITASIRKSNLITISLGSNEIEKIINSNISNLDSKKTYKEIDKMIENYREIISKIRYISSAPIILIGYYNPLDFDDEERNEKVYDIYEYSESRLASILEIKNVYLINLTLEFKNNPSFLERLDKLSPSIDGYKYIASEIIELYDSEINA